MLLGTRQNIHIPEDTREAEFILVLQITSVAPFEDEHGQKVFALLEKIRDIEFRSIVRYLAVADVGSVEPHVEAGVHSLKVQEGERRFGIAGPLEAVQIGPAGIILRDIGRIEGEGIAGVGVLVTVVTAHLPAEGHLLLYPPLAGLIIRQIKMILQVMDAGIKGEAPWTSAQHLQAVGALSVPGQHIIAGGARDVVGPVRHSILVEDREVLIESWNDQNRTPFLFRFVKWLVIPLLKSIAKRNSEPYKRTDSKSALTDTGPAQVWKRAERVIK